MGPSIGRVLIVCERLPLPVRGGADLRVLGLAKALSGTMKVGVVSISDHRCAPPSFVDLWRAGGCAAPDNHQLLRQLVEQPSDPFAPFASDEATAFIRTMAQSFRPSVVVFYRLQSWRLAGAALEGLGIPSVLDLDESNANVVRALNSLGGEDPASRLRVRFTRAAARYEERAIHEADAVWVSTVAEAQALGPEFDPHRVSIVPNVVDVDRYAPTGTPRTANRLVFPANFAYPPNEAAARELVGRIAPLLPDQHLFLVGSFLPAWLRESLPTNVTAIGPVASMAEHLAASSAALMPLRAGTGTRMKILECLASATPVVSTAIGAAGLDLDPGRHYLGAQTPEGFAQAVRTLSENPDLARAIAAAGLQAVRDRYSVEALVPVVAAALGERIDVPATPVPRASDSTASR